MKKLIKQAKYSQLSAERQEQLRSLAAAAQVYAPLPHDDLLLFWQDKCLLAFAAWASVLDEAQLLAIAVAQTQRRQGIGAALLSQLMQLWQERAVKSVFLEVRETNIAAQSLYEKFGFRQTGRRRAYYPPLQEKTERENAVLMQKEL